jgi:beta-galactosidase
MADKIDWAMPHLTRRELLAQAACGAAALSAAPYLRALEVPQTVAAPSPRITESFDFGWKFAKGDVPGAEQTGFGDSGWRALDLPHDWSIEGPVDEHAPSGGPGGYMPTGVGWYRKTFSVPESYRGKVVTLEFDGVYQNSDVWINGHHLGRRPYGYVPFVYELTEHLEFGAPNVVAVRVDNSNQTNCRWYSGSGIYRHTWLHVLDSIHVAQWGTFVTCPRIQANSATVEIRTTTANSSRALAQCRLSTSILDASGVTVATLETPQTIAAADSTEFIQQLTVPAPKLWSPDQPYLYMVRSTLRNAKDVVDVYATPLPSALSRPAAIPPGRFAAQRCSPSHPRSPWST